VRERKNPHGTTPKHGTIAATKYPKNNMAFELEQHEWLAEAIEREQRQQQARATDPAQQALAERIKAQALKRLADSRHLPGQEAA
jgi:hypothetical protein